MISNHHHHPHLAIMFPLVLVIIMISDHGWLMPWQAVGHSIVSPVRFQGRGEMSQTFSGSYMELLVAAT